MRREADAFRLSTSSRPARCIAARVSIAMIGRREYIKLLMGALEMALRSRLEIGWTNPSWLSSLWKCLRSTRHSYIAVISTKKR